MKMWVVGMLLKWLGWDLEKMERAQKAQVGEMVGELVRLREEKVAAESRVKVLEATLGERQVSVNVVPRVSRELRLAGLRQMMCQVEVANAMFDVLDECWLMCMNTASHPQMPDRERSWNLGGAEMLMKVKEQLEVAAPKAPSDKRVTRE